jgi:hypothetical protein
MTTLQSATWLRAAVLLALAAAPFHAQQPIARPKFEDLHASSPVGNTGPAQGARFWLDFLKAGGTLQAIRVCTHAEVPVIASIHFRYQTTLGRSALASIGEGGTCAAEYMVPAGVTLVGFSGVGGWYIDQLRFHFSDNSTTPTYGGTGGDHEFSVTLRKKEDKRVGRVAGFFGTQDGGKLESLGLLYWAGA